MPVSPLALRPDCCSMAGVHAGILRLNAGAPVDQLLHDGLALVPGGPVQSHPAVITADVSSTPLAALCTKTVQPWPLPSNSSHRPLGIESCPRHIRIESRRNVISEQYVNKICSCSRDGRNKPCFIENTFPAQYDISCRPALHFTNTNTNINTNTNSTHPPVTSFSWAINIATCGHQLFQATNSRPQSQIIT